MVCSCLGRYYSTHTLHSHQQSPLLTPLFICITSTPLLSLTAYQAGDRVVEASQSIIQIFVQYRLNIEGYMAIRGASDEHAPVQASGNYGLKDQQLGECFRFISAPCISSVRWTVP